MWSTMSSVQASERSTETRMVWVLGSEDTSYARQVPTSWTLQDILEDWGISEWHEIRLYAGGEMLWSWEPQDVRYLVYRDESQEMVNVCVTDDFGPTGQGWWEVNSLAEMCRVRTHLLASGFQVGSDWKPTY